MVRDARVYDVRTENTSTQFAFVSFAFLWAHSYPHRVQSERSAFDLVQHPARRNSVQERERLGGERDGIPWFRVFTRERFPYDSRAGYGGVNARVEVRPGVFANPRADRSARRLLIRLLRSCHSTRTLKCRSASPTGGIFRGPADAVRAVVTQRVCRFSCFWRHVFVSARDGLRFCVINRTRLQLKLVFHALAIRRLAARREHAPPQIVQLDRDIEADIGRTPGDQDALGSLGGWHRVWTTAAASAVRRRVQS